MLLIFSASDEKQDLKNQEVLDSWARRHSPFVWKFFRIFKLNIVSKDDNSESFKRRFFIVKTNYQRCWNTLMFCFSYMMISLWDIDYIHAPQGVSYKYYRPKISFGFRIRYNKRQLVLAFNSSFPFFFIFFSDLNCKLGFYKGKAFISRVYSKRDLFVTFINNFLLAQHIGWFRWFELLTTTL